MMQEPTYLACALTRLAWLYFGKSVYREFANRLPLTGGERVLDFGCKMGTVAYYVAQNLPEGHLVCLDISARWLNAVRKTLSKFTNVSFVRITADSPLLFENCFDVVYCHFVLHDMSPNELGRVICSLGKALKSGGILAFREPLNETQKLGAIKRLMKQNGLMLKESRVTDVPRMGNALESLYAKP